MARDCAHSTLEVRRRIRKGALLARGVNPNQPGEMLDLYLGGERIVEIARAYGLSLGAVYSSIAKEALYRLMTLQAAERLEELKGIEESME